MTPRGFFGGLAVAIAVACGGGQTQAHLFSTDWDDDGGRSIEAIRQRIDGAHATTGVDLAVGVSGNGDKIIGLPLAGGAKWTFAHPLDARPAIATSVVVGSGGGEVFALDAATGRKLWVRPTGGLTLHAAGDDGSVTVITLSRANGGGSSLLAVTHDGTVVRQVETDQSLGAPAVLARLAFIPWGGQYVSVFDLSNGNEAARVLLREKTSRAWTLGGGLYFGEVGVFRFDDRIRGASRNQATHIALPQRELPGTPKLMVPGDERLAPVAGAPDKIRLYARPSAAASDLRFDSDRFFATYFKLVMAFTATKGDLAWVHTHPVDIIAGSAANAGLVTCDTQGKVTVLDASTGGLVSELDLGEPVKSCVVATDGFTPSGGAVQSPGTLGDQLTRALLNRDLELATAQRLLLRELSMIEDEVATKTLVDLASDPRTSPAMLGDARVSLANRRNGARFMLEALERHYDFLKDVLRPPPVGPIAQALAAMNEKAGAPPLATHLLDPADSDDDLKETALALVTLGDASQLPTMKQFFAMYRGAPEQPEDVAEAEVAVGHALMKLGGAEGRALVDLAILSNLSNVAVKTKLQAIALAADAEKGDKPKKP